MRNFITILLVALSFGNLSAQNHQEFFYEVYQGDKLYEQGNFSNALKHYEVASGMVDFVPTRVLTKFVKAAKKAKNKTLKVKYKSQLEKLSICPRENAHIESKLTQLLAEDQRVRKYNFKLIRYYWDNVENPTVANTKNF